MLDAPHARDTRPVQSADTGSVARGLSLSEAVTPAACWAALFNAIHVSPRAFHHAGFALSAPGLSHGGVRAPAVKTRPLTSAPRQRRFSGPNEKSFTLDCSAITLEERIQMLHATAMGDCTRGLEVWDRFGCDWAAGLCFQRKRSRVLLDKHLRHPGQAERDPGPRSRTHSALSPLDPGSRLRRVRDDASRKGQLFAASGRARRPIARQRAAL